MLLQGTERSPPPPPLAADWTQHHGAGDLALRSQSSHLAGLSPAQRCSRS